MKNVQHKYQSKLKVPCFAALHDFGHRNDTKLVCTTAFEKRYLLVSQICIQFRKIIQHVPYLSIFVLKLCQ